MSALRLIEEIRLGMNKPTYKAFINIEKAFDTIRQQKMFEVLKKIGIEYRNRLIQNLYKMKQKKSKFEITKQKRKSGKENDSDVLYFSTPI